MPRRRRPETREILPDPLYNSTLAEKFVNSMMWDGKKAISQGIFYSAMDRIKDKPDLVVLDPPRAGLEPGAAERLARAGAARITYVSCEPPTLARDLAVLLNSGYKVASVDLFDLFPQTFHMETIVKLERAA